MSEDRTGKKISRYAKAMAKPGQGEALAAQMLKAAELSAAEPGCLQYSVNRAAEDPDTIWVTEAWSDQEAMDASLEAARESGMIDEVRPLIEAMEMVELVPLGGLESRPGDGDPATGDAAEGAAPGFEIRNLEDLEDMAAAHGFGETGQARFAFGPMGLTQAAFSQHRLHPGKRQSFGHRHDHAEEVYVVIAGSGRVKLDDEIREIADHDAIRVSPGVSRAFESGPDGLEFLALGQRIEGDAEILPNWWSD